MMKVVVVPSEAGCNLNLVLGLLRRGFRGIEKRPDCRDIFRVASETSAPRPGNLLRHAFNGFPSLLPTPEVGQCQSLLEAYNIITIVVLERLCKSLRLPERAAQPVFRALILRIEPQCRSKFFDGLVMQTHVRQLGTEIVVRFGEVRI